MEFLERIIDPLMPERQPDGFIKKLVYVPIKNNGLYMTVSILYKIHTESKYTSLHNP